MNENIIKRTYSAIVMLLVLSGCLFFLPSSLVQYCVFALLLIVLYEWLSFAIMSNYIKYIISIISIVLYWLFYSYWLANLFLLTIGLGILFIFAYLKNTRFIFAIEVMYFLLASLCFGQSLYSMWHINVILLLLGMVLVWGADSMAFFIGSRFGKTKCFTSISPNKTLEGVFGAVIMTSVIAGIYTVLFNNIINLNLYQALLLGLCVGSACMLGDLIESAIKRRYNVKDSANWIPGHGGLLDRLDGMILALPAFWYMLHYWT